MTIPQLLLVEYERRIACAPARRLIMLGYTMLAYTGFGREGIQHARHLRPDPVFMERSLLEEMKWIVGAAYIQTQMHIPITYLTCSHASELRLSTGAAPPCFTIQKPISNRALQQTIQLALATVDQYPQDIPLHRGTLQKLCHPPQLRQGEITETTGPALKHMRSPAHLTFQYI